MAPSTRAIFECDVRIAKFNLTKFIILVIYLFFFSVLIPHDSDAL